MTVTAFGSTTQVLANRTTDKLNVCALGVTVTLLPVHGRYRLRLEKGVPGNFRYEEALELCHQSGVTHLVPHHWGMFNFNTIGLLLLDREVAQKHEVTLLVPRHGESLMLGESV